MDIYFTSMNFELNYMSHPLVPNVNSPEDIKNMFDEITYFKVAKYFILTLNLFKIKKISYQGGSILRMARFILGENTFRNGINVNQKFFSLYFI